MNQASILLTYPFDEYVYISVNQPTNRLAKKLQKLIGCRLSLTINELYKLLELLDEIDDEFQNSNIVVDESGICFVIKSAYQPEKILGVLLPVRVFNEYKGRIRKALRYAMNRQDYRKIADKIDFGIGCFVSLN